MKSSGKRTWSWRYESRPIPTQYDVPIVYRSYARQAMYRAIELIDGPAGGHLLMPEYICVELTQYLQNRGLSIRYYRLNRDLTPDLNDVQRKLTNTTIAIIGVHYFGFFCDLERLFAACRERGIWCIEDNAHGFLGSREGECLGRFGDLGVLSMRKTALTRDGAALLINSPELRDRIGEEEDVPVETLAQHVYWFVRLITKPLNLKCVALRRLLIRLIRPRTNRSDSSTCRSGGIDPASHQFLSNAEESISACSWIQLRHVDHKSIKAKRRRNYTNLLRWLQSAADCQPICRELEAEICPQACPVMVEDGTQMARELRACAIDADYWPNLPEEVAEDTALYQTAHYYRRHLVLLPVHQYVTVVPYNPAAFGQGCVVDRLCVAYGLTTGSR